jgi:CRP-like cAMP-binding protein
MRLRYGRGWLILHCVDAIPISWVALAGQVWWHYLLLAVTRLGRLHRAIVANETIRKSLVYDSWASLLVPLVAIWFLTLHFISCMFYLCAEFEGLDESWVSIHGFKSLRPFEAYFVAIYFAFVTLSQCGTGDIIPHTSSETILAIFVGVVGVSVNAYILGTLVRRLIDAIGRRFLYDWQNLSSFLAFKKVEPGLQREVSHYFYHKWMTNEGAEDPNQVYRFMPESIRNRFRRDVMREMLEKVAMFRMANDPLKMFLANLLRSVEFIPGEEIIKQGASDPSMLLLEKGFVDVFISGERFAQMVNCDAGQFFGEQELFIDVPRSLSLKAVTHVSGWQLSREDLQIEVREKPEMRVNLLDVVRILYPDYLTVVEQMFADELLRPMRRQEGSSDVDFEQTNEGLGEDDTDEWGHRRARARTVD